jgi:hypothetical protein
MTYWDFYEKHHENIKKVFTLGTYLLSLASALGALFLLLVAKNELHLVTWIENDTTIYPSDKTVNEVLPLTFEGVPAKSVRVVSVRISNYGKTVIGKQESKWDFTLASTDATPLAIVGEFVKSPDVIVFEQLPRDKSRLDIVRLQIGALEPKATIEFKVLLVNSTSPKNGGLTIAHGLDGLPSETAVLTAEERIFLKTGWKIMLLTGFVLCLLCARSAYDEAKRKLLPKDLDQEARQRAYHAWQNDGSPLQTPEQAAKQFEDAKNAIVAETPIVWGTTWRCAVYFGIGLIPGIFLAKGVAWGVSWLQWLL